MEAWMHYDRMLPEVFQQPGAYPFPFGSEQSGVALRGVRRGPAPPVPTPPARSGGQCRYGLRAVEGAVPGALARHRAPGADALSR